MVAIVVQMPVRHSHIVELRQPRFLFDHIQNPVEIPPPVIRVTTVDQQRLANRRDDQRCRSALNINEVDIQPPISFTRPADR